MTFGELLAKFKSIEDELGENALTLLDDTILRNGLLAWQSVIVDYDPDLEYPNDDNNVKFMWKWMWENVSFDAEHFALIVGVQDFEIHSVLERLKAFRLIYPDGTSNSFARACLRQLIRVKTKVKTKQEEKKTKKNDVEQK